MKKPIHHNGMTLKKGFLFLLLSLCLCASVVQNKAWAHGGEDHGEEEPAPAAAVTATGGATQTELELRLSDLSQGAAGTQAPLVGAKVRGFLKHAADGDLLARVTARPEKTPGVYSIYFSGDKASYSFGEAGKYLLELNIQPASGDAVNATVPFTLQAAAPALSAVPLWRRALPFVLGALVLVALLVLLRKLLARRKTPPRAPESGIALLLLLALLGAAASTRVWAHGGEDHGEEEPTPAAATNAATASPNIQTGESSVTAKADNIGITLVIRTQIAAPETLAPGEVALPPQTAQLLQIKTQPVQVAQLATGITFNGQIAPNPNGVVRVASIVPGRVTRLNAAQGDTVKQGEVVAIVESRAIGEAQSAYQQAQARFNNAKSNLNVVQQQAKAGVFSRAPLEIAQKARAEAAGDVKQQQAAVQQTQVALDNATRLARVGSFASPALEAAKNNQAQANEAVKTAQAGLSNAQSSVEAAQSELARRRQLAASGSYQSRPVEEARRVLVAAQSARAAAQSEVATTRANLSRAKTLAAEGLVSRRDLEAAQQAYDTATARLETSQADEKTAQQELARQQELASSNVAGAAEVQAAASTLAGAQADVRTRQAEVQRANSQLQVANVALSRERAVFAQNIANRREIETARANLQAAKAGLSKARGALAVANEMLKREQNIFRKNLNNTAQVQQARSGYVAAQADLRAARSTLALLKSSPGSSVDVPIRAPMSGVVQSREVAVGELIQADAPLMTIVNLQSLALEAALFEADFARVRIGSPVRVTTDAVPGRSFSGRINFLGSQVDPQTRTVTARAQIENPGSLRPGMFVRGQIQTGVSALGITVPASAVLEDGAAKIVFVTKGDKYERREVVTGTESNGRIAIKSGLKQEDTVVTEGAAALRAQAAKGV
jgi:RND family efflux transporter MFP subunit